MRPIGHNLPFMRPADPAQAYAVQHAVWQRLNGETLPTAWKVGTPAHAIEPTAAAIFSRFLAQSPAAFPANGFRRLGIEAEIAVSFGRK